MYSSGKKTGALIHSQGILRDTVVRLNSQGFQALILAASFSLWSGQDSWFPCVSISSHVKWGWILLALFMSQGWSLNGKKKVKVLCEHKPIMDFRSSVFQITVVWTRHFLNSSCPRVPFSWLWLFQRLLEVKSQPPLLSPRDKVINSWQPGALCRSLRPPGHSLKVFLHKVSRWGPLVRT